MVVGAVAVVVWLEVAAVVEAAPASGSVGAEWAKATKSRATTRRKLMAAMVRFDLWRLMHSLEVAHFLDMSTGYVDRPSRPFIATSRCCPLDCHIH